MKSYAISIVTLALSSSSAEMVVPPVARPTGFSADRLTDFVRGGINVFDYLTAEQQVAVRSCRRTSDVVSGIQAAVAAAARGGAGGRVVLPDGCYRTGASIRLPSDVELVGASIRGTKIVPDGNFPAIVAEGSFADGLTGVGVQNLSIACVGMSNEQANGIRLVYVNRGTLKDLYFNGCHHALDLYDQWQTRIDNIQVDGQGVQQNGVGVYMGAPTDRLNLAPNNAVILSNSTVQNVSQYGYQLIFFAGSKFYNDEAMNGITGWQLCGSAYVITGQACQFGHFMNIVTDSTAGPGIVIDQADNANPVNNVMLDHVWIGSSHDRALAVAGVTYSQFDNLHITRADNAVWIRNSNNVKLSANIDQYNERNNGSYSVVVNGGRDNVISANNARSAYPTGYNGIVENGPTYGNAIWGGLADCAVSLRFGDGERGAKPQPSFRAQFCRYEVQGRHVRVQFRFAPSASGGSGQARIVDLPFPVDRQGGGAAAGNIVASGMSKVNGTVIAQPDPGMSSARLSTQGADNPAPLTEAQFTVSSTLSGTLDYIKR